MLVRFSLNGPMPHLWRCDIKCTRWHFRIPDYQSILSLTMHQYCFFREMNSYNRQTLKPKNNVNLPGMGRLHFNLIKISGYWSGNPDSIKDCINSYRNISSHFFFLDGVMFSLWCSFCVLIGPAIIVNCHRTIFTGCSNNCYACFVEISKPEDLRYVKFTMIFFYIVHIAMLTILCRYRLDHNVDIVLITWFYIVTIDIIMLTTLCRYRVFSIYLVHSFYIIDIAIWNLFVFKNVGFQAVPFTDRLMSPIYPKHSGSIPRECMCRLRNIAMRDYQESATTGQRDGQTDRRRTKWFLYSAMLRRRHKNWSLSRNTLLYTIHVNFRNDVKTHIHWYIFLKAYRIHALFIYNFEIHCKWCLLR